jgi:hypothetical protein
MSVRSVGGLISRLTEVALAIGALGTVSYATGAHIAVRYLDPPLGAWWQSNEFWIMEGGASALGLLIAIRIGARLVDARALRRRTAVASLIAASLVCAWLTPAFASLARMGWDARAASIESRLVSVAGYSAGKFLDKILIAGVYFVKTACFALLAGLALFGTMTVTFFAAAPAEEPMNSPQAPKDSEGHAPSGPIAR